MFCPSEEAKARDEAVSLHLEALQFLEPEHFDLKAGPAWASDGMAVARVSISEALVLHGAVPAATSHLSGLVPFYRGLSGAK